MKIKWKMNVTFNTICVKTKNPASSPAKRLGEEIPGLRCKDIK